MRLGHISNTMSLWRHKQVCRRQDQWTIVAKKTLLCVLLGWMRPLVSRFVLMKWMRGFDKELKSTTWAMWLFLPTVLKVLLPTGGVWSKINAIDDLVVLTKSTSPPSGMTINEYVSIIQVLYKQHNKNGGCKPFVLHHWYKELVGHEKCGRRNYETTLKRTISIVFYADSDENENPATPWMGKIL